MARLLLVQQTPGSPPSKIPLEKEVLIGREPDCRVVLNDDLVSRHHARVLPQGRMVLVKDLGSRNGTTVNGSPVTEKSLGPGQSFTVGRTVFTVREDETAKAPATMGVVLTEGEEGSVYRTRSSGAVVAPPPAGATQALTLEQMAALSQRLAALNRIAGALASLLDVEALLAEVVEQVFGLFPRADRCCVLMDRGGELVPVRSKTRGRRGGDDTAIRLSRTVVSLNRDDRKAVLSFDTATDQRLSVAASIVASGIRSIMSVPIVHKEDFFGILYLDTGDIGAPFSEDDLELMTSFAGQVAIFVKNARLVGQIQRETELRTNLGRYLSPSVVAEIAKGSLVPSLGGETREGTCLFSDVVGFTRVCRSLSAAEVVKLLNRFFRAQVDAVFRHDGTVDKFGGDAMLCVWGAPVPMKDHAGPAVRAALEMQNRLYDFNLALVADGSPVRIRMGIGLNSGSFIAGNVGSEERLEYTVIGDDVNLAQRVEEKAAGEMVLVSDATLSLLRGACTARLKPTTIRGSTLGPFTVHSVRGMPRTDAAKERHLLVSLPVRAGAPGQDRLVDGIVVEVDQGPPGPVLVVRVPESSGLGSAQAMNLEAILPEVPGIAAFAGGVMGTRPHEEGQAWMDVEVLVPALPEPLATLLRPGTAWESPLGPESIPRE